MASQAHLCPLPLTTRPRYWAYDYVMRLYPLPDTVCMMAVTNADVSMKFIITERSWTSTFMTTEVLVSERIFFPLFLYKVVSYD